MNKNLFLSLQLQLPTMLYNFVRAIPIFNQHTLPCKTFDEDGRSRLPDSLGTPGSRNELGQTHIILFCYFESIFLNNGIDCCFVQCNFPYTLSIPVDASSLSGSFMLIQSVDGTPASFATCIMEQHEQHHAIKQSAADVLIPFAAATS